MKRYFYILLFLFSVLTIATNHAIAQIVQPALPMVCSGSISKYGVNGVGGSSFTWTITSPSNVVIPYTPLNANQDSISISWGNTFEGGIYSFSVLETTSSGCVGVPFEDAFIILNTNSFYLPVQGNQEVFVACEGESIELDPGLFKNYLWSVTNAPTTQTYITTLEGTYQVRLVDFNNSCTFDTIQARFNPLPTVWLGNDTILFANQTLELDAFDPTFDTYKWYNTIPIGTTPIGTSQTLTVDGLSGNKTYTVTVTDNNGCVNSDEINVGAANYRDLKIPSVFTPNGDQINDKWYFPRIDKESNQDLYVYFDDVDVNVYNRTGKLVWNSTKTFVPWDGKDLNGRDLPMDSYHYIIRFRISGHEYMYKGSITIIR